MRATFLPRFPLTLILTYIDMLGKPSERKATTLPDLYFTVIEERSIENGERKAFLH